MGSKTRRIDQARIRLGSLILVLVATIICCGKPSAETTAEVRPRLFFVSPGEVYQPGVTIPAPIFPGASGAPNIGDIGVGRAYGFRPGSLTALIDDYGIPFSIPGIINSGIQGVGFVKFVLEYDPSLLSNPVFRPSTSEFVNPNSLPGVVDLYEPAFDVTGVISIDKSTNPATVTVELTADTNEPPADGIFNLFNVQFVIDPSAPPGTFARITFQLLELKDTNDVLIPTISMNSIDGGVLIAGP